MHLGYKYHVSLCQVTWYSKHMIFVACVYSVCKEIVGYIFLMVTPHDMFGSSLYVNSFHDFSWPLKIINMDHFELSFVCSKRVSYLKHCIPSLTGKAGVALWDWMKEKKKLYIPAGTLTRAQGPFKDFRPTNHTWELIRLMRDWLGVT